MCAHKFSIYIYSLSGVGVSSLSISYIRLQRRRHFAYNKNKYETTIQVGCHFAAKLVKFTLCTYTVLHEKIAIDDPLSQSVTSYRLYRIFQQRSTILEARNSTRQQGQITKCQKEAAIRNVIGA